MDIEKPTCFNYDNCIVREHSDVDSSSETSFSLGLTDWNASAPQTSFHSSTSEDRDSNVTPLKLGPYDCYVLMVGFLKQIEDYLHKQSTAQDEEKHQLLEYSMRIREALMANCEHFVFSDNANQTTVASVSHNATGDNDVINNMEKTSVATKSASSRNMKETSNPLAKTKIGKTRSSRRLQNRINLKKDSRVTVTSVSVAQNGTAGNDLINNSEETAASATRSSFKKAMKTSTPVPKAKVEENRFSRRLENRVTIKMSGDTSNKEHNIKNAISRKRCASSSNYKPAPVKRAKYVEQDARMARIQARLQQTMSSFQETSGSSGSEATRESPKKAPKARTMRKNLDMVKTGAKDQVELNGEVKRLNATRRSNRTRNKGLSKSLYTVYFEKNPRQLSGEETSKPRNKSLSISFKIAHRNNPKRAKHEDRISKGQSEMGKVVDSYQQTATRNSKSTTKKSQEKCTKSKDLVTVNTENSQKQLSGKGARTRSKCLSKSLNIADKKSSEKGRGLRTSSGTSNIMVTNDDVNQNQRDDTKGTLSTSRVVMKRKLYSAETWLQTLSETMP